MRKLAVGAAAFSTGVIASAYLYVPKLWYVLSGAFLLCFLACLFIRRNTGRALRIFFLMLSLGLIFFSLYHSAARKNAASFCEHENFTATLTDFPEDCGDYTRVCVRLTDEGRSCRALIYDYYGGAAKLRPGDRISFSAKFRSALDGETSETQLSKGILFTGSLNSEIRVIKQGTPWLHVSKYLSHAITEAIPDVFPEDTVPFLRAQLIGNRSDLYDDTSLYPALLRSGFMHTVAISGMHISIIAGFCMLIFGGGKRASIVSLVIIWLFIFMSGNTPSAARAGIMQSVLLFAPFVKRENDPLTSLSLALAVLLLINPFAAKSTGLQLSFAAVLGIILFSGRINEALMCAVSAEKLVRILRYPVGILSASIGVMAFTIPLSALHFGYVTVLSLLTNVLALWAIPLCFCGAYVCLLVYLIFPGIAVFLGSITAFICRYIFAVCSLISRLPHAALPYDGFITLALFALIYALFIIFGFSGYTQLKKIVLPASLSLLLIVSYFAYYSLSAAKTKATVSVLNVGQGECVAAYSGNRAIVVDCGTSDHFTQPGVDCADLLYVNGQKNIDALFLTHLHSDHVSGVCHLMELIPVGKVFIPVNVDMSEDFFPLIRETAARTGTEVVLVDIDSALQLGDMRVELYPSYIYTEDNESCMCVMITAGGKDFLITGDSTYLNEMELTERLSLDDTDVLIAGHHGSNGSSCTAFLRAASPELAVISVGRDNRYGHPSSFAIERMLTEGMKVLRTDLNGTVTFSIN